MRIFLANPPWRENNKVGVRAGSRWPYTTVIKEGVARPDYVPFPFFLSYATSLLKKHNFDVLLIDAVAEGLQNEEFFNRIKKFNPHIVVLETSTPSINFDLSLCKKIKESREDVQIILCGPHVSIFYNEILIKNSYIDFILVGEYEYTLLELVSSIHNKEIHNSILLGVAFRNKGRVVFNGRRQLIQNIDQLPWPAREFLPMLNYNDPVGGIPAPSLQMWASRGCPFRCNFCLWPRVMYNDTGSYRTRDPKSILDEIEYCLKQYNFKSIYFDDDTFNIGKIRILKICDEFRRRKLFLPWAIMARADTSDKATLKAMRHTGLYAIKFGIESGSQELLDRCGKNLELDSAREMIGYAKRLGIRVHLTFSIGLPGESWETVDKTIEFVRKTNPDSAQFSITTPFPGTRYFEEIENSEFLLSKEWEQFDGSCSPVIRTDLLTDRELKEALRKVQDAWLQLWRKTKKRRKIKKFIHKIRWNMERMLAKIQL